MYNQKYPNLFKPMKVKNLLLKNRIMSAPNMLFRTLDGRPDEYYVGYLEHKARGGAAIVTLGEANVCDGGNHTPGMETSLQNLAVFSEMSQVIHEHGAIASVELTHGGFNVKGQFNKDQNKLMAPSGGVNGNGNTIREMTPQDMEYVANGFADTAEYYIHAGFDTVLLHVGHGWLLSQFLSPIKNKRTDEYGGSLENRMRFPLYVLKKVRERLGPNRAICARVSGAERAPGGFTTDDIAEFLSRAQAYIDFAEISTDDFAHIFSTPYMQWAQNLELCEAIKKTDKVNIPLFTMGTIMDPQQAEDIIASGKADGVSMSRALIADPYLPKKAQLGKEDEIRPCIRCLNCTGSDNARRHFICSVNPLAARETRLGFSNDLGRAKTPVRVLVVGGGPAGMYAAVTAAARGHKVTLVEQQDRLGGALRFTDTDSHKNDLKRYKDYLVGCIKRSNVNVMIGTEVTDEIIESVRPEAIIIATGAKPIIPRSIKGVELAYPALEAYLNPALKLEDEIVIIGGGLVGVEQAAHLATLGKKVTVLEMTDNIAGDASDMYKMAVVVALKEGGAEVITGAKVTEITSGGVQYTKDGNECFAKGGTVLYAVGMHKDESIYFDLYDKAPAVYITGDCAKVGKVDGAVHDGFFAALDIGDL